MKDGLFELRASAKDGIAGVCIFFRRVKKFMFSMFFRKKHNRPLSKI